MFPFFKKSPTKFISGRISEQNDAKDNFFYLRTETGEVMSEPYPVKIPQKVVRTDPETKRKSEAILVQAERVTKTKMRGQVLCTIRLENGSTAVCQLKELKLSTK